MTIPVFRVPLLVYLLGGFSWVLYLLRALTQASQIRTTLSQIRCSDLFFVFQDEKTARFYASLFSVSVSAFPRSCCCFHPSNSFLPSSLSKKARMFGSNALASRLMTSSGMVHSSCVSVKIYRRISLIFWIQTCFRYEIDSPLSFA